jgi:hypothetical protein
MGLGRRSLVLADTIVANSPVDSADRMPLAEVVDTLTMVPPAVDALCAPPLPQEEMLRMRTSRQKMRSAAETARSSSW